MRKNNAIVMLSANGLKLTMPRRRRSEERDLTKGIGKRLARLRKERGLSQAELAKRLGVAQGNVSAYERGEIRLQGDLIVKMAKLLKVSADELLGLTPIKGPPVKDRRFMRRLELIDRLPKRDKDAILRILINASLARKESSQQAA